MAKKVKENNLYYMDYGQALEETEENINRKKAKEREKRIKRNKQIKEDFDNDTETVIQMTNKNKIKKDQEQRRKLIQQEQRRKKKNKKIKFILKTFLLLAIIVGGVVFAMVSPMFNIKNIDVLNNNQISAETIISLSEIKMEENIFRFSSLKVAEKVKQNAYIEKVKIYRKIPNKIQIEIEEREHNYNLDFLGKYAYINKQGYVLEIAEDSKEKILLQGFKTTEEQIVAGNRLNEKDLERLEDVIKIMNAAKEYDLDSKVTSIDISDKNQYNVYLAEEGKKVYLGDNSNLSNKMLYVNAIIEEEKGKKGEIFANGDLNNKFKVFFRESLSV